jgi:hypothetical protein
MGLLVGSTLAARLSVVSRLKRPASVCQKFSYGFQPFFTQNPNFDHSKPQNSTQKMFTGHIQFKTLKHTQFLRLQLQFINNSPIHKTLTTFNNNNKLVNNSSFQ